MVKNYIFIIALIASLNSCKVEETPLQPIPVGDLQLSSVNMETDYEYQIYFDLATNSVIQSVNKFSWDVGFSCNPNNNSIILNSSKAMFAAPSEENLNNITSEGDFENKKRFDKPQGNPDSTAINLSISNVWLIDRGYDLMGRKIGFAKLEIIESQTDYYEIRYSLIDEEPKTITINKNNDYNYVFLSFEGESEVVEVEPPKEDWDIVFTQYLADLEVPYLVTGVMQNQNKVKAYLDTNNTFENIDRNTFNPQNFSSDKNVIGYDWKYYDFDAGSFIINTNLNYVIQSTEGLAFKFRLLDFYNESGDKGNPVFEFKQL